MPHPVAVALDSLLPTAGNQRSGLGADAPHRQIAPGISVCRLPNTARHALQGGAGVSELIYR